jgi:ATP-dependent Clp protease ATP-binding subunit ClpA
MNTLLGILHQADCPTTVELEKAGVTYDNVLQTLGTVRQNELQKHSVPIEKISMSVQMRFTNAARLSMGFANAETIRLGGEIIGTESILLGLYCRPNNAAVSILTRMNVDHEQLKHLAMESVGGSSRVASDTRLPQTPEAKLVIQKSITLARELGHSEIGTEHFLLAILKDSSSAGAKILTQCGVTYDAAASIVREMRRTN